MNSIEINFVFQIIQLTFDESIAIFNRECLVFKLIYGSIIKYESIRYDIQ